jgi:general secretion pathway protein D
MGKYPFNVNLWYRTRYSAAVVCALALMAPPLSARNRKGDKLLKAGQKAESLKDYDAALSYYDQAVSADPNEPAYLLADQRIRGRAAEAHVILGRRLQSEGKLEEALAQFEKAFMADPSSQVSLQNIRDTTVMIKQRAAGPAGVPILTPAERARQETERRINSLEGPPVLRPINSQISNLRINNQPARVLYESVGKLAGINVLFDPAGIETTAGKTFNVDLSNVTLQEALNYIALQTHTFWKPISQNAIFVTQESDPKRQEYQDEVVKIFYIQNASTANEFTEIFNAVRTAARLTVGVQAVPTQNAIITRGSVDTMMLVEKLVHDLDRPKAEVVVDVIIMSANRTKTTNLGASLLAPSGQGLYVPFTFTPRNPTTTPSTSTGTGTGTGTGTTPSTGTGTGTSTSSGFTIARAGRFSSADYSTAFPNAVVQALLNDATTRILQRPQVRATDGGKSSILIGSSIPFVSGSLNSAVATPGSIPYATTQFQQINVGTQIEFAPHVNGTEDISMHIKVELSNVLQRIPIGGIDQPVIGKQTDEADLRMRDGEVTIIGGLSDKEFNATLAGIPGLANLPLLGYAFGTKNKTNTDNEILIAMIPHIVRALDFSTAGGLGVYAGSERVIRVERRREPSNTAPAPAPASAAPGVTAPPASPLSPASPTPGPATTPGVVPTPNPRPPVTTPPAPNNPPVTNPQTSNPPGASTTPATTNRPPGP